MKTKKNPQKVNSPGSPSSSLNSASVSPAPDAYQWESHDSSSMQGLVKVETPAQLNRNRLGNMLKLPKVLRWMCCEWFLSNLDDSSFRYENEFERLLSEHFPLLATRNLRRREWVWIRRELGKPRRCSTAFLQEERRQLNTKRRRIRAIQQRKNAEFVPDDLTHLPDRLPLPLTIGTKVMAVDFHPNGVTLVAGTLQGIDPTQSMFRVLLDKPSHGTSGAEGTEGGLILKSYMDSDVSSIGPHNTVPTNSLLQKTRVRSWLFPQSPAPGQTPGGSNYTQSRYSLVRSDSMNEAGAMTPNGGTNGTSGNGCQNLWDAGSSNMPARLLTTIARLARILSVKKEIIARIREISMRAERLKSYDQIYPEELFTGFNGLTQSLNRLNSDLSCHVSEIQRLVGCGCSPNSSSAGNSLLMAAFGETGGLSSSGMNSTATNTVPGICDVAKDASATGGMDMVQRLNLKGCRTMVKDRHNLDLITKLTSLMVQIQLLGDDDGSAQSQSNSGHTGSQPSGQSSSNGHNQNGAALQGLGSSHQLAALQKSIQSIKDSLDPSTQRAFFENVEVHLNVIKSGILQAGNLYMFTQATNGAHA